MKNFKLILILALIILAMAMPALAVNLIIDGMKVKLDSEPLMRGSMVFVPLRGIFEKLGATVTYEKSTQTILAHRKETKVKLVTGDPFAFVDGSRVRMMAPPFQKMGRTYVPLRFISESLGCRVGWHPPTRTVAISSKGKDPFAGVDMDSLERVTIEDKKKKPAKVNLDPTAINAMKYLMQKNKDAEAEKREKKKMKIEGIKSNIKSDIQGIKPIKPVDGDNSF